MRIISPQTKANNYSYSRKSEQAIENHQMNNPKNKAFSRKGVLRKASPKRVTDKGIRRT